MKKQFSRRDFIRITAISAGAVALGAYGVKELMGAGEIKEYSETQPLLGTYITLKIVDTDSSHAKAATSDTFAEISRLEAILSRYSPTSEVSILNSTGAIHNASSDLIGVFEKAKNIAGITSGAFDASVLPLLNLYEGWGWSPTAGGGYTPPDNSIIADKLAVVGFDRMNLSGRDITFDTPGMSLTLDGIAMGYIIDQAAAILRQRDLTRVLVGTDSDWSLSGMRQDGQPWQIGITDPRALDPDALFTAFGYTNGCLATSGDYEHAFTSDFAWNHIIDPRIGHSPRELASATVLAPDGASADALATAAMVMGISDSLALFNKMSNVQAYLIGKDMKSYTTQGFNDAIKAAAS